MAHLANKLASILPVCHVLETCLIAPAQTRKGSAPIPRHDEPGLVMGHDMAPRLPKPSARAGGNEVEVAEEVVIAGALVES